MSVGSFSNDDGDGNENVKKAIGLWSKTTSLHAHHTFLYISVPLLHDYDMKMPSFTFYGERISISKLECGPKEINSRELDKTFIIVTLQVQLFGRQLARKG